MRVVTFLGFLAVFCIPAALAALAAARLARRSREEWKVAAWLPVAPLALWGPYVALGVTRDPTSHNLWPFELAAWGLVSVMLFGIVLLGRRLGGRPRVGRRARRAERDERDRTGRRAG